LSPDLIVPPFVLAAGLLMAAGLVKLRRPRASAQAMLDAGLPGRDSLARGLGTLEVGAGVWGLVAPAAGGAFAVGALYLAFTGFLAYVVRTHPDAGSCGCAGAKAVPPSRLHLALNLVAASSGFATAVAGVPPVVTWLGSQGWAAVPVLGGLVLAGWLAVVAVSEAPVAWRAWSPPTHQPDHDHGDRHVDAEAALAAAGIGPGHASLWPATAPPGVGG
jgi:hypothetical protein